MTTVIQLTLLLYSLPLGVVTVAGLDTYVLFFAFRSLHSVFHQRRIGTGKILEYSTHVATHYANFEMHENSRHLGNPDYMFIIGFSLVRFATNLPTNCHFSCIPIYFFTQPLFQNTIQYKEGRQCSAFH